MQMTKQWQCSCGAWINYAYGKHPHITQAEASVESLIAARLAGNENPDLGGETKIENEWRTPAHKTREVPADV